MMGSAIARSLERAGFRVIRGRHAAIGGAQTYADAVASAPFAFLCVPWPHALECVRAVSSWQQRVLIDVTNPESDDGRSLTIGHHTSGAEEVAALAVGARVVKAFNYTYAELLVDPPSPRSSVLYCGEDDDARQAAHQLIARLGFDPVDAGPLRMARFLEPMAMLTVNLVREQGHGPRGIRWQLVRE